jgi:hypothetical protein
MFKNQKTGIIIENETTNYQASSNRANSTYTTVYNNLAIVRDITSLNIMIDINGKQKREEYVIYLDKSYIPTIENGMRIKFDKSKIGHNEILTITNNKNIITGYIRRIARPNLNSISGKLELYITTN